MKVKSRFEDVDELTAKVTSATVKNKTRQAKFAAICCPPLPVVTRWRYWLKAALCYANDLSEMKATVLMGLVFSLTQAKISLPTIGFTTQLLKIKNAI